MGTNYYLRENLCEHCGRYETLHIGRSSAGWTFGFRGYPEGEGPRSAKEWRETMKKGTIVDEYDREVTQDWFWMLVEGKKQWNGRDAMNQARMAAHGPGNEREMEYSQVHKERWIAEADGRENWLDDEGHGFSGYEFS